MSYHLLTWHGENCGGGAVVDYKASGTYLACNPGTNKLEEVKDYQSTAFGGPIVSIGIDYRW